MPRVVQTGVMRDAADRLQAGQIENRADRYALVGEHLAKRDHRVKRRQVGFDALIIDEASLAARRDPPDLMAVSPQSVAESDAQLPRAADHEDQAVRGKVFNLP